MFVDPFSFLQSGGMNPADANGYTFALHFDLQTPVPEASTWMMMLLGFTALGFGGYRRLRRDVASIESV